MKLIEHLKQRLKSLYKERESLKNRVWMTRGQTKSDKLNALNVLIKEYEDIFNNKQIMRDINISDILDN